jgi:hypothetical protein
MENLHDILIKSRSDQAKLCTPEVGEQTYLLFKGIPLGGPIKESSAFICCTRGFMLIF